MIKAKLILIDTMGQLPILGGITGPILHPFNMPVDDIRTLLAHRISVKEVLTDEHNKPILKNNRYVTIKLTYENYDKKNSQPKPKEEKPKQPPVINHEEKSNKGKSEETVNTAKNTNSDKKDFNKNDKKNNNK